MSLVADALLTRLRQWGIDQVFGYPGDGIDPLLAAFGRAGEMQFIQARHEENAAFMATGHAKYTGRVGCCMATHGPGAIHLLNGLYDAKLDKKPVLAIIGEQHRSVLGSGYQQEIDAPTLFKDVCGAFLQTISVPEQMELSGRPRGASGLGPAGAGQHHLAPRRPAGRDARFAAARARRDSQRRRLFPTQGAAVG